MFLQTHCELITESRHCTPINCTDPNFKRVVHEALQHVPPDEHSDLQCMVINLCKFMKKPRGSTSFDSSKNRSKDGSFKNAMIRLAQFYIKLKDKGYDYLAQFPLEKSTHENLWWELKDIATQPFKQESASTPTKVSVERIIVEQTSPTLSTASRVSSNSSEFNVSTNTSPIPSVASPTGNSCSEFSNSHEKSPITSSMTSPTETSVICFYSHAKNLQYISLSK